MPFYKITLNQGAYASPAKILEAVRRGNATAGYPATDVFQRLEEFPRTHLVIDKRYPELPRDRTDQLIVFEVLTSTGTASEQRDRIRTAVVQSLVDVGIDANDIIMFFVDYDRATSTFGGGKPPAPIKMAS